MLNNVQAEFRSIKFLVTPFTIIVILVNELPK